jgi:methylphosphotriester-DNA--protein-cysteine methyltransferase
MSLSLLGKPWYKNSRIHTLHRDAAAVFSTDAQKLSYFVYMLTDLKLSRQYDGFLFLAESARNVPKLDSHHHIELELNLVVRGWITYVVGKRCFTFPVRTLLWLFPKQEHQLVARSADAQFYVAVFKPSLIGKSCRTSAYSDLWRANHQSGAILDSRLAPDAFDLIHKTMDSLMPGSLDPDVLNREAGYGWLSNFSYQHGDPEGLNAGLRHLLLLCWRSQKTGKIQGDATVLHRSVRRALQLMSEDGSEMNLSQLAQACGASEAYLSRIFRKQIGVPLSRYRNSLRLSRFWEEYRQPEKKTMAEAVYAAGFGSYAQFFKVFTQTYGQGPRACLMSNTPP